MTSWLSRIARMSVTAHVISAVLIGAAAGLIFGPAAGFLGETGKLFIQLIKAVATPLVFFAIVESILAAGITWQAGRRLFGITMFNAALAATIGMAISNFFSPGKTLDAHRLAPPSAEQLQKFKAYTVSLDINQLLNTLAPASIVKPFLDNSILAVVFLALLTGFALRKVRNRPSIDTKPIESAVTALFAMVETILGWVLRLSPIAIFGVTAKTTGEYGLEPLVGLSAYLGASLGGMAFHIVLVYGAWVLLFAGRRLHEVWAAAKTPTLYSIGVNSSLASLPLTLQALDRLKISKSSARLGACVGTNLNNDGILLYEAMSVLFIAQAYGIDLTLGQQFSAAVLCVIAAVGVAGVPEAGIISLSLVISALHLPLEILPLLLTVDWIVARARSATNVLSDMTVSIVLDRMERRANQ